MNGAIQLYFNEILLMETHHLKYVTYLDNFNYTNMVENFCKLK